ncbi:hypothetical protein TNCV_1714091 [Trichonephila clavipes]|nr:hypothetical protein TNCV_1714091 [Trichonephila clavipes]
MTSNDRGRLATSGLAEPTFTCDDSSFSVCAPPLDENERQFPSTKEEILKICPYFMEFQRCLRTYAEKCGEHSVNIINFSFEMQQRMVEVAQDICDEDSPLHSIGENGDNNSQRVAKQMRRYRAPCCQVIYSQFGLAIHQNDHQARRSFVECAQNEIAVVPDFHKRILFSDEAHFWLNGYVNKQNCRIWSEANPQVYVETPLHPEKLTVWCALWAGGILLQTR